MRKTVIAVVVIAAAGFSACKKETAPQPVRYKIKSIADVREHTGWERGDSLGVGEDVGSSLLRTASPSATPASSKKTKKENKQ